MQRRTSFENPPLDDKATYALFAWETEAVFQFERGHAAHAQGRQNRTGLKT
jgi:DNA polymerase III alpha subunit